MNYRADNSPDTAASAANELIGLSIDDGEILEKIGDRHILSLKVSFFSHITPQGNEVWATSIELDGRYDGAKCGFTEDVILSAESNLLTSTGSEVQQSASADFTVGVDSAKVGGKAGQETKGKISEERGAKFSSSHHIVQQVNSGERSKWRFNPKYLPQDSKARYKALDYSCLIDMPLQIDDDAESRYCLFTAHVPIERLICIDQNGDRHPLAKSWMAKALAFASQRSSDLLLCDFVKLNILLAKSNQKQPVYE